MLLKQCNMTLQTNKQMNLHSFKENAQKIIVWNPSCEVLVKKRSEMKEFLLWQIHAVLSQNLEKSCKKLHD